jgi:hypothetical protein
MTPEEMREMLAERRGHAAYLLELFEAMTGFTTTERQCMIWLGRHHVDICTAAIERTAEWMQIINQNQDESREVNYDAVVRYASGTMKGMTKAASA